MASAASKTPTYGAPLPPRNVIIFLPVCGGGGGKKRRQLWRITCRCSGKRRLLMRPDTASNEKERGNCTGPVIAAALIIGRRERGCCDYGRGKKIFHDVHLLRKERDRFPLYCAPSEPTLFGRKDQINLCLHRPVLFVPNNTSSPKFTKIYILPNLKVVSRNI
jgi:hypothetical protein